MGMHVSRFLKSALSVVAAVALVVGLLPAVPFGNASAAYADALWQRTETPALVSGTYVEGEALAYVVDNVSSVSGGDSSVQSVGDDLLAGAEDVMHVDAAAKDSAAAQNGSGVSSLGASEDAAAGASVELAGLVIADGSASGTRAATTADLPAGTIRLVHSDSMTTAELIAALEQDPRVLFAEPNYIAQQNEAEGAASDQSTATPNSNAASSNSDTPTASPGAAVSEDPGRPATELGSNGSNLATQPATESATDPASSVAAAVSSTTWGPSAYTEGQVPNMTRWQWGNSSNGSLAGTYQSAGSPDIGYAAWNDQAAAGGLKTVVVGIIDTGVDETNPDLANVLWTGSVFGAGGDSHGFSDVTADGATSTTKLKESHGTHVAGLVAAEWNDFGTSGVAPNVQIMSLRSDDGDTLGSALRCMNYAKLAAENNVPLVATNNSWGFSYCASNMVNIAIVELGERGVVSVFSSGNSGENTDASLEEPTTIANNPYAVVVNSMDPNGGRSYFSNYGVTTTEVFAAGSDSLSTYLTKESNLAFVGEVNAHAPVGSEARDNLVSYTSFDGESVEPFASFSILKGDDGVDCGSDLRTVERPAAGVFDGTGALAVETASSGAQLGNAGVVSEAKDLSGLPVKPRYVSFRYAVTSADNPKVGIMAVRVGIPAVETRDSGQSQTTHWMTDFEGGFGGHPGYYAGCYLDLSRAETLTPEEEASGITGRSIDWENFSLSIQLLTVDIPSMAPYSSTVLLDSIAVGSCRYPYQYTQGTSMAAPVVTGAVAAIAGVHDAELGTPGTAAYAEKLAALTKGSGVQLSQYANLCATGTYATVDGANDPGPVIVSVADGVAASAAASGDATSAAASGADAGQAFFEITGYFMPEDTTVSIDGTACTVANREDLGNGKYKLTVAKPTGYAGGVPIVEVSAQGKYDRGTARLSPAAGTEPSANLFAEVTVPDDVAAQLSQWIGYDMVGFAGKLYVIPRCLGDMYPEPFTDTMFVYDPATDTWESVRIPVESLTVPGGGALTNVIDVTACANGDTLAILVTGASVADPSKQVSVYATLDAEGTWTPLGSSVNCAGKLGAGTLAADDAGTLYLFGGSAPDERAALKEVRRVSVREDGSLALDPAFTLNTPRSAPRVSYGNGKFVVSGGVGGPGGGSYEGVGGVDLLDVAAGTSTVDVASLIGDPRALTFSSGALPDGRFLLVGPESANGTADAYVLNADGTVAPYDKRVYPREIYAPASAVLDGKYYVLATVAPTGDGAPTTILRSLAIDTPGPGPAPGPGPDPDDGDTDASSGGSGLAKTGDGSDVLVLLLVALSAASLLTLVLARRKRGIGGRSMFALPSFQKERSNG